MFKAIKLSAVAALAAVTLTPAAAEARHYDRDGYSQVRYGDGYRRGDRYYGNRGYYRGDRGRNYNRGYYGGNGRCRDKGTGGTIIGAIAGGLLGNEVVGRRGDNTAGTIVGAGIGALAGRAIDRNC